MRAISWSVPAGPIGELVAELAPRAGTVMLYGPDAAVMLDRVEADTELTAAGSVWTWGRAFDTVREVLWRREGARGTVVLATVDGVTVPEAVAAQWGAGSDLPGSQAWTARRARLLLWTADDTRVHPFRRPASVGRGSSLAVEVEEYDDPAGGVAWRRYRALVEVTSG